MDERIPMAPYSMIADVYDGMMAHVEYRIWGEYVDRIFQKYGKNIKVICELACGTGTLAIVLSRMNYEVTCVDISESMIEKAKTKAQLEGARIRFLIADMLSFSTSAKFDAVLCLYDSMNYVGSEDELVRFFYTVSSLVVQGGLFVFDVCTEANSLRHFDQRYERDREYGYTRRSRYDKEKRIQFNEVEMLVGGKLCVELHQQRIYPLSVWTDVIGRSPFSLLAVLENLTHQAGSEESERVHFVLAKR